MLDIRLIREKPDFVRERLATRGGGEDSDLMITEVLTCDKQRRVDETGVQQFRAQRNELSKKIGALKGRGEDTGPAAGGSAARSIEDIDELNEAISRKRRSATQSASANSESSALESVPVGKDASANRVVERSWGEKPKLKGPVLDHVDLGEKLEASRSRAGDQTERERIYLFHRRRCEFGTGADSISCSICIRASMVIWKSVRRFWSGAIA